jgi:hypothetical protein
MVEAQYQVSLILTGCTAPSAGGVGSLPALLGCTFTRIRTYLCPEGAFGTVGGP